MDEIASPEDFIRHAVLLQARQFTAFAHQAKMTVLVERLNSMGRHNALMLARFGDGSQCYEEPSFAAVEAELEELSDSMNELAHEAHRHLDEMTPRADYASEPDLDCKED